MVLVVSDELNLPSDRIAVGSIGQKASGLRETPHRWVPPYFVLTTDAFARWRTTHTPPTWISQDDHFLEELERLAHAIGQSSQSRFSEPRPRRLIVRSSAVDESLDLRGAYTSMICEANAEALVQAIEQVWQAAEAIGSQSLAVIVQVLIHADAAGHLSNERRVARRNVDWLLEVEQGRFAGDSHQLRVEPRTRSTRTRDPRGTLTAGDRHSLLRALRSVAHYYTKGHDRFHFEWVWDGAQVWIVQADKEHTDRGPRPGSESPSRVPPLPTNLQSIRPWQASESDWTKLAALRTFSKCRLETPSVLIIEGDAMKDILDDARGSRTRREFSNLFDAPVVIRTERRRQQEDGVFNQPLSPSLALDAVAWDWMRETLREIVAEGDSLEDVCFFVSRTIVCRSSAWALARPGSNRVRIDSIWGVTDGLQYYPHDSFEHDILEPSSSVTRIRCKPRYLAVDAQGKWVERRTGAPWDWESSLTPSEVVQIARLSQRVADVSGRPMVVMFLLGGHVEPGEPTIIPWFASSETVLDVEAQRGGPPRDGPSALVRDRDDLRRVTEMIERGGQVVRLVLHPRADLARSKSFLDDVIVVATREALMVQMDGSILSHAYYQLRRAGISVSVRDSLVPGERRIPYEKLVRDKVPVVIRRERKGSKVVHALPEQALQLLRRKAVEESLELLAADSSQSAFEELADLYEVILSYCSASGHTIDDLANEAERKRISRGGFDKGFVLLETSEYPLIEPSSTSTPVRARARARLRQSPLVPRSLPLLADQAELLKVELPLIPPDSPRIQRWVVGGLRLELEISYSGKLAVLRLRRLPSGPVDGSTKRKGGRLKKVDEFTR